MTLKGWHKELPDFISEAVKSGQLKLMYSKKDDFEYLQGTVKTPWGTLVTFQ